MTLGADHTGCTTEFIEAMRARLVEDDPGAGANVDQEPIKKNFAALGLAVYRIATVRAETASDGAADAEFWAWVAGVQDWLGQLAAWQAGVVQAFTNWAPAEPAEVNLRTLVRAVPSPGPPPGAAPVRLRGRIE
jgi:hypothetical protein